MGGQVELPILWGYSARPCFQPFPTRFQDLIMTQTTLLTIHLTLHAITTHCTLSPCPCKSVESSRASLSRAIRPKPFGP